MKKLGTLLLSLFFIVIGVLGLLSTLTSFQISWEFLGPTIPLLLGIFFEIQFFSTRKDAGVLVPGGILSVIGVILLLQFLFGERIAGYVWPFYLSAPAFGLFQLYWYGGKDKGLLIPVGILTVLCVIFLMITLFQIAPFSFLFPAVLLSIGLYFLWKYFRKEPKK